jgi:hypothetical protein
MIPYKKRRAYSILLATAFVQTLIAERGDSGGGGAVRLIIILRKNLLAILRRACTIRYLLPSSDTSIRGANATQNVPSVKQSGAKWYILRSFIPTYLKKIASRKMEINQLWAISKEVVETAEKIWGFVPELRKIIPKILRKIIINLTETGTGCPCERRLTYSFALNTPFCPKGRFCAYLKGSGFNSPTCRQFHSHVDAQLLLQDSANGPPFCHFKAG